MKRSWEDHRTISLGNYSRKCQRLLCCVFVATPQQRKRTPFVVSLALNLQRNSSNRCSAQCKHWFQFKSSAGIRSKPSDFWTINQRVRLSLISQQKTGDFTYVYLVLVARGQDNLIITQTPSIPLSLTRFPLIVAQIWLRMSSHTAYGRKKHI